jgi:hypothetical protein
VRVLREQLASLQQTVDSLIEELNKQAKADEDDKTDE